VSVTRRVASIDALRAEGGGVLVAAAILMLVLAMVIAVALEVGNWFEHRRHLQLQTDAAVLAAGQLFGKCISDPANAMSSMEALANQYGGFAGSTVNAQVGTGGPFAGSVAAPTFNSTAYPAGGTTHPPDDTPAGDVCATGVFDVKATEHSIPNMFSFSPLATVHAHARVELRQLNQEKGLLPVAVPDVRFNYAFATFVDESTGAAIPGCSAACTVQLQKIGTNAKGQQLWSTPSPLAVPISVANVGVRVRLVAGTDSTSPCGQLYTECYTDPSATQQGLVYIRGWSSAPAPAAQDVWLLPGTCAPDADAYFAIADCSAGLQAMVNLGDSRPISATTEVWATVDNGSTQYQLTPPAGATTGLLKWSLGAVIPVSGAGAHTVQLSWSWLDPTCPGGGKKCTQTGSFGTVQRAYEGSLADSGPLQQVQVFESGVSSSGADSFPQGTAHTLGVTIATSGTLEVQSKTTDPIIYLRVVGSQNQSVDCDPAVPNLRGELAAGCAPTYVKNPSFACPSYNDLWSTPQPWPCAKLQTGGSVGQVAQGIQDRVLGGSSSCTAPIHWPYDSDLYPDDPRVLPLIVTPFGTFSGNGNDIVPVLDFGAFYVMGWNGDPCPGAVSVPKGYIAGHFIKYIPRNPDGVGDTSCYLSDPTQITPCVAVLTR